MATLIICGVPVGDILNMLATNNNFEINKLISTIKIFNKDFFITINPKCPYDIETLINARFWENLLNFLNNDYSYNMLEVTDIFVIEGEDILNTTICVNSNNYTNSILSSIFLENENPNIQTLSNLYISASWLEREIFELYGIFFVGHNTLSNLLNDYNTTDNVMLNNFPVAGTIEIFWCNNFIKGVNMALDNTWYLENSSIRNNNV